MSVASTGWIVVAALGLATYLLKAAGPVALGGRDLPAGLRRVTAALPTALLAGLVVAAALGGEGRLVVDARVVGVAAAGVALWRGAGFVTVVGAAALATAAVRALAG